MRLALDATIGTAEIVLAVMVLRSVWGVRRHALWFVVLAFFFVVRGVDRFVDAFTSRGADAVGLALDASLLVVLVLLLAASERVVRGLELAEDAARFREAEYRRALADYRRLTRHRLATPLTAIIGSVQFLRELRPDEKDLRADLLDTLERESLRLKSLSLDPYDALRPDERELRPSPELWRLGSSIRTELNPDGGRRGRGRT